jgi:hypothetical protein
MAVTRAHASDGTCFGCLVGLRAVAVRPVVGRMRVEARPRAGSRAIDSCGRGTRHLAKRIGDPALTGRSAAGNRGNGQVLDPVQRTYTPVASRGSWVGEKRQTLRCAKNRTEFGALRSSPVRWHPEWLPSTGAPGRSCWAKGRMTISRSTAGPHSASEAASQDRYFCI